MQSTSSTTHTTTSPSVYSQAELVRSQQNNSGSYQTETESTVSLVRAEPNAVPYIRDQTRHHSELSIMEDPLKRLIDERLACVVEPLNKIINQHSEQIKRQQLAEQALQNQVTQLQEQLNQKQKREEILQSKVAQQQEKLHQQESAIRQLQQENAEQQQVKPNKTEKFPRAALEDSQIKSSASDKSHKQPESSQNSSVGEGTHKQKAITDSSSPLTFNPDKTSSPKPKEAKGAATPDDYTTITLTDA